MDEVIQEFLAESHEGMEQVDSDLVALEKDPGDSAAITRIFRAVHTVKGTCGFFGFSELEEVAHAGENLLSLLRDGTLRMTQGTATLLLELVDAIRDLLAKVDKDGGTTGASFSDLAARLNAAAESGEESVKDDAPQPEPTLVDEPDKDLDEEVEYLLGGLAEVFSEPEDPKGEAGEGLEALLEQEAAREEELARKQARLGDLLIRKGWVGPEEVAFCAEKQREGDPRRLGEILVEHGSLRSEQVLQALEVQTGEKKKATGKAPGEARIRVDVEVLDRLVNLVGELVLSRNQLEQIASGHKDALLRAASQQLDAITTALQGTVMKTRM